MKSLLRVVCFIAAGVAFVPQAKSQAPAPEPCKVCTCVPKTDNTKKVFGVKCEEYCVRYCSCWPLFCKSCGCDDSCGELRIRHRLVIKKVPGCDTVQCLPKDCPPTAPAAIKEKK